MGRSVIVSSLIALGLTTSTLWAQGIIHKGPTIPARDVVQVKAESPTPTPLPADPLMTSVDDHSCCHATRRVACHECKPMCCRQPLCCGECCRQPHGVAPIGDLMGTLRCRLHRCRCESCRCGYGCLPSVPLYGYFMDQCDGGCGTCHEDVHYGMETQQGCCPGH
jgi:hypothetical protein